MRTFVLSTVAACGLASSAHAGIASAIFAETGPKAVAPGMGGLTFTAFDRPYRSANGQHWIITATVNTGNTATDELVITGMGAAGTTRAQEGVSTLGGNVIRSGSIDTLCSVNDSGDYAFTANNGPTTSTLNDVIVKGVGSALAIAPNAASNLAPPGLGGPNNGTSLTSANIDNAGRTSWRTAGIPGAATGQSRALLRQDGTVLDGRSGVTIPGGLLAGTESTVNDWDTQGYSVAANGTNWLVYGDTNFATTTQDNFLAVNGTAVVQEGVTSIAGGTASLINEAYMQGDGTWWARGSNTTGTGSGDWVIFGDATGSYAVRAMTDAPIVPGATELWDDTLFGQTFFMAASNDAGDSVVGGVTNNADEGRNAVLVWQGADGSAWAFLREGDAIDLDGNGLLDDNAFISIFNNDDCFLAGDTFYFTGDIVDGAGVGLGQAFMSVTVPTPGALALLGLGGLFAARRRR
ncbi:MAG: hypothetical protein SFY69_05825 [Planctomycetota bacterium]|nr:hypothetical protein [Planctomycetota bacterium]